MILLDRLLENVVYCSEKSIQNKFSFSEISSINLNYKLYKYGGKMDERLFTLAKYSLRVKEEVEQHWKRHKTESKAYGKIIENRINFNDMHEKKHKRNIFDITKHFT